MRYFGSRDHGLFPDDIFGAFSNPGSPTSFRKLGLYGYKVLLHVLGVLSCALKLVNVHARSSRAFSAETKDNVEIAFWYI
jgi:hypothetical protein